MNNAIFYYNFRHSSRAATTASYPQFSPIQPFNRRSRFSPTWNNRSKRVRKDEMLMNLNRKFPRFPILRYRRLVHEMRLSDQIRKRTTWLPNFLAARLDNLERKPYHAFNAQQKQFLASGFLTNFTLTEVYGESDKRYEFFKSNSREDNAFLDKIAPEDEIEVIFSNDDQKRQIVFTVTCPTRDVVPFRKALEVESTFTAH
jgi:hypothetical protein